MFKAVFYTSNTGTIKPVLLQQIYVYFVVQPIFSSAGESSELKESLFCIVVVAVVGIVW